MVIDGPFAETKEQLLGLYVLDCASEEAAIEAARDLRRVNRQRVYEIRPIAALSARGAVPGDGGGDLSNAASGDDAPDGGFDAPAR